MSDQFFSELKTFTAFAEACSAEHYYPAPTDWVVVVTDVKGSTKAINNGRYKDVNMVGAACIAAAVNTCKGIQIPYVFGGDGATFLIPPRHIDAVQKELVAVARFSKKFHDLDLRCGAIPITEITNRNEEFGVAKFEMPTGATLAMFNGGGAALADDLIKNNEDYSFSDIDDQTEPDLEGLSCRWQPIPSRRDTILTLLVMSTDTNADDQLYHEINSFIIDTLDEDQNPANDDNLSYKWPSLEALRQAQMVWRQGNLFKNILEHVFLITLFNIMNQFGLKLSFLDVPAYKKDMILNSDYRKFDGMLRMVVDCTKAQAEKIENYLKEQHDKSLVVYGTHYSDTALMTCFVESLEKNGHVHFIDGNDGGYALAAKGMKEQLKNIQGQN